MKIIAFIRISDGAIFSLNKNNKEYMIELSGKRFTSSSYTKERLLIAEFLPIFEKKYIKIYSGYFKTCGSNSDYIEECEVCGMSWYTCLCSHDD